MPQGPLAAFGSIQRALRETEKRITGVSAEVASLSEAVEGKLQQLSKKVQQHERKLREETQESVADLEELVMQMYDEHGKTLAEHREGVAALKAQLEAEQAASRAAQQQQQKQLDVLAQALRRQQDMINEYIGANGSQASALEARVR